MFEVLCVTFLAWYSLFTDIRVDGNAKRPERSVLQYVYVRVMFECVRVLDLPESILLPIVLYYTMYICVF